MSLEGSARFEGAGAILECSLVPWDTEIFGFPVAQIDRIELAEGADPTEVLEAFDGWCADQAVRLVSCRLDHGRLRESMALEATGLSVRGDGLRPAVRSVRRDRHAPP